MPPSNNEADGGVENREVSQNENIFYSCINWWLIFNNSELEKQVALFTNNNNSKTSHVHFLQKHFRCLVSKKWRLQTEKSLWGPVTDIDLDALINSTTDVNYNFLGESWHCLQLTPSKNSYFTSLSKQGFPHFFSHLNYTSCE